MELLRQNRELESPCDHVEKAESTQRLLTPLSLHVSDTFLFL